MCEQKRKKAKLAAHAPKVLQQAERGRQAAGLKEKQAGSRAGRRWIDWRQERVLALHPNKPLDRQVSSENAFEHTGNARGSHILRKTKQESL